MPTLPNVTCLGCGCACDDIEVVSDGQRIQEARRACALGASWFGDGIVPARALVAGRDVGLDTAIRQAAQVLLQSERPLVYLAPDLSCEAQRAGIAIADALGARLDTVTSATVMTSMLAQQERGRAGASLGEVRNRADTVVFWGVDPAARYPRFTTRYAPEPAGAHAPSGRRSRTVVAVDVGEGRGPDDADVRMTIRPEHEVASIATLREAVERPDTSRLNGSSQDAGLPRRSAVDLDEQRRELAELATLLTNGRYVVIVVDAEPGDGTAATDAGRAEALIALTQALNGPTRCALSLLRGGGNRSGADSVTTWQTGYPSAMTFARGYPEYRPHEPASTLTDGDVDAVLLLGSASALPATVRTALASHPCAIIGPRASEAPLASTPVAIDTAVAGIHEGGTAFRMDDIPLPLRPSLSGPPSAASVVTDLLSIITRDERGDRAT